MAADRTESGAGMQMPIWSISTNATCRSWDESFSQRANPVADLPTPGGPNNQSQSAATGEVPAGSSNGRNRDPTQVIPIRRAGLQLRPGIGTALRRRRRDDGCVLERIREVVDAEWEATLGVDRSRLHSGGVHVVAGDLGSNDAMSFLVAGTCFVVVPEGEIDAARRLVSGLGPRAVFSAEILRTVVGPDGQVDGPSVHTYADEGSFRGVGDPSAVSVGGGDVELMEFLEANELEDSAESGFPRDPVAADPEKTQFWVLREHGQVVAAGNLTEWRGRPADVGVLVGPADRGRGRARRLVGAMVIAALPTVGVVRYRALASNAASLAVARHLGFVEYGQNYRARKAR